jgi:hypothetical protein
MQRAGCRDAERWADARADGALAPQESLALDEHLADCPACARRLALLGEASDALERGRRPIPHGFANAVLRRLPAEAPRLETRTAPTRWRWVPVAAGLLVAALTVVQLIPRAPGPPLEGPRVQVELELADVAARSVAVAGDFNDWDAAKMERGADGVWRIRLSLEPGRYRYAFVVDDDRWVADPRAPTVVDSGYGGANAVLEVSL